MKKDQKKVPKEFLFLEREFFKSCHAATVLPLQDGTVLAACFGGAAEGDPNVAIWLTTRDAKGVWGNVQKICYDETIAHWNPVLFYGENEIILSFKVGVSPRDWKTYFCTSSDNGKSWSSIQALCGRGAAKNKPICLSNGTWLSPCSIETEDQWTVIPEYSTDKGKTWTSCTPLYYRANVAMEEGLQRQKTNGVIQPSFWESENGCVHMLMRSTWNRIYRSDSTDFGKTWCPAYETELLNNNSGIDLTKTADGTLYLCCNPVDNNWGRRTPLTLFVSTDNGKTFEQHTTLEENFGEFSYPAIVADENFLHIVYTWNRCNIAYVKLPL